MNALLAQLTSEINVRESEHTRNYLEHARIMGGLLAQVKAELKKQKIPWKQYLASSVRGISPRTARLYVQVHSNWDYLAEKAATVATFSLKDAQQALNALGSVQKQQLPQAQVGASLLPQQVDPIGNLTSSLEQTHNIPIDLFERNDWEKLDRQALSDLLDTIVEFETTVNQSRTKLSRHLLSLSGNCCPNCALPLIQEMESCLNCF